MILDETYLLYGSSKGNQMKWFKDNIWYKADYLGYESLSEYVVSRLLKDTSVKNFVVDYEIETIIYKDKLYRGCKSKNFLKPNEKIITLSKLFRMYLDVDIYNECDRLDRTEIDCIKYIVDNVAEITGLYDFGKYLTFLFEVDRKFLNEDRHFNNIAVIFDNKHKEFSYCPLFDNGAALLSDTTISFGLDKSIETCLNDIKSKPISPSFDDQTNAAISLYGSQLDIYYNQDTVDKLISDIKLFNMYTEEEISRVRKLLTL